MSDSSSDEFENNEKLLFKNRPEWKDVTPLPQDDGDEPIVAIDYSEKFADAFDYFRAIVQKKEYSDRALELTEVCSQLNSANYTVWQYRREILKALGKDLNAELEYIKKRIIKQSKNYQVWHHRKVIVEWLQDGSKEKELTEQVFNADAKNYHAWQHRQWAIKTFNLFDGELEYVDSLLQKDIRNNSAWNQRHFVINNTTGFTPEVVDREIDYTLDKIKQVVENESAWNYLRGLLLHGDGGLSQNQKIRDFCEELYANNCRSPFLLASLVDMCYEQVGSGSGDSVYTLERAKMLCSDLAENFDTIRAKYWLYMMDSIEKKANGESTSE